MKKGIKLFFSSIWDDITNLIKKHWLRFCGFICCFIVPVIVLLTTYVQKVENATKYVIPFAVIVPLTILIIIWWGKARRYFSEKLGQMKVQNSIQAGKHAGAIIIFETIKALMTVLPFALCYVLVKELQEYYTKISNIFLFIVICQAVGGALCILDTIVNVTVVEEENEQEQD